MNPKLHSVFSFTYNSNAYYEDHTHDSHELIYFINGSGETRIDGNTYTYEGHHILLTPMGSKRDHTCFKDTDFICIRFHDDSLDVPAGLYKCDNRDVLPFFTILQKEATLKKYRYFDMCNHRICEILIHILRIENSDSREMNIYDLIRKIDDEALYNISIKEMAETVAYSYDRFRHKFKEITGKSPTNYLIDKRIEKACKMLLRSDLTCTDVSQLCGFSSPAQFSTLFKKRIGVSPKHYAK